MTLSGALIHQAGGRGAEVADLLHRALSAEAPDGVSRTAAAAYRELGYLSVQRGVPDRAAGWLDRAMRAARGIPGRAGEDPGDPGHAGLGHRALRGRGGGLRRIRAAGPGGRGTAGSRRSARRCWAACICCAGTWSWRPPALDRALDWVAAEHWTAFEPFVAGVRGETYLAAGRLEEAAALIDRSWVMAELAGDHCYMALAAGAEARLFLAHGDLAAAEHWIDRGLEPKPWYLWYSARLLDTAAEVAIAAGLPAGRRVRGAAGRAGQPERHAGVRGPGAVAPGGPRRRGRRPVRALAGQGDRQPGADRVPGPAPRRLAVSWPQLAGPDAFRKPCPAVDAGLHAAVPMAIATVRTTAWKDICHGMHYVVRADSARETGRWKALARTTPARVGKDHAGSGKREPLPGVASLCRPRRATSCLFHETEDLQGLRTLAASEIPTMCGSGAIWRACTG